MFFDLGGNLSETRQKGPQLPICTGHLSALYFHWGPNTHIHAENTLPVAPLRPGLLSSSQELRGNHTPRKGSCETGEAGDSGGVAVLAGCPGQARDPQADGKEGGELPDTPLCLLVPLGH